MSKKLSAFIFVLVFIYVGYLFVLPAVVNLPQNAAAIERQVQKRTGFRISTENPELKTGLLPSINLKADKFAILNADNSNALYIEKPSIKIAFLPLIFKRLTINGFGADNLAANLVTDEQPDLKLGDYKIPKIPDFKMKNVSVNAYEISLDKTVYLTGRNLNVEGMSDKLTIKGMKITGNSIDAALEGQINKLNSKKPHLDLNIKINPTRAENIIPLLPGVDSPGINLRKLKETVFRGTVKGNLKITGRADTPAVNGEIIVSDAYLVRPFPKAQKALLKLNFTGDKTDLDITIPVSAKERVLVKGPVELYGERNVDLRITSTKNIDLKAAQVVLNPLHEILKFDLGPVPVMDLSGWGNIDLGVKGNNTNSHLQGVFNFRNAAASFSGIPGMVLKNSAGTLVFDDTDIKVNVKSSYLNGKAVAIEGLCNVSGALDLKIRANGQNLRDLLNIARSSPMFSGIQKIIAPVKSASGPADINVELTGKITDLSKIVLNDNIFAKGSLVLLSDNIDFGAVSKVSGKINFDNLNGDFDLMSDTGGLRISAAGKLKDNIIAMKGKIYPYTSQFFSFNGMDFEVRNNVLELNKINAVFDGMPVLLDGKISDIIAEPYFNLYINAKPTQEFLDRFFNNKALYPIKLKGDVNFISKLTGSINSLNAQSQFKLDENSRIYYMGASIGDTQYPVKLTIDTTSLPGKLRINNFQYDKIMSSQNNRPYTTPQLNLAGTVNFLKDNEVGFQNFRLKTQAPTDAKIFNIIFRKPIMKQGIFTSDLVINGTASNPQIIGTLDITSIDMPFFDTVINDVNLNFKPNFINIISKGTVLDNFVKLNALAKNKLTPPYIIESMKLETADLDINRITGMIRDYEADSVHGKTALSGTGAGTNMFDTSMLVIRKAELTAGKIKVRNINADNFSAVLNLDEKSTLYVNPFKFNIAKGSVEGTLNYNLLNYASDLKIHLNNADALIMTEALFDLKGQIYGSMTGDANLVCSGKTYETCLQTLSGSGSFKAAGGKMPKLGSLEYLLKAGNLVRGGIMGLSINSLTDLIVPLKTGEFESISGDVAINSGVAENINIYSRGKDLNMYMKGSYNLVNSVADMEIFGSLSKNITSVFGKVRNASLNTLFNTIPGIGESDAELLLRSGADKIPNINTGGIYRIFNAEIYGDINGDNYVRSFRWVK